MLLYWLPIFFLQSLYSEYSLAISCQCAVDDEEKADFDVTNLGSHNYFNNLHTYHGSSDSLIGEGFLLLSGRKSKKSLILTKKSTRQNYTNSLGFECRLQKLFKTDGKMAIQSQC